MWHDMRGVWSGIRCHTRDATGDIHSTFTVPSLHPPPHPTPPVAQTCIPVTGEVFGWGNNVGGYLGVVGTPLRTATQLPIPATAVEVQVGCKGTHWQTTTIFCHIWVLDGTCGGGKGRGGGGGRLEAGGGEWWVCKWWVCKWWVCKWWVRVLAACVGGLCWRCLRRHLSA